MNFYMIKEAYFFDMKLTLVSKSKQIFKDRYTPNFDNKRDCWFTTVSFGLIIEFQIQAWALVFNV